jgi:hypothetical protein
MANHFNIPYLWPFKMVPNTTNPGYHFDDKWYCEQIRNWERKVLYEQKWNKADITPLQIESSVAPEDLAIKNKYGLTLKSIAWTAVITGIGYKIWQLNFDASDVADQTIFIYQKVIAGIKTWEAISEPINLKPNHVNTLKVKFRNSFNKDDIAWSTGITMLFRIECDIHELEPKKERSAMTSQLQEVVTLDATAFREFQLLIAEAPGVPRYMIDIFNRIFCCDYVQIQDKQIESKIGSEFKITATKGYPLVGASLDVVEAKNKMSLQFADDGTTANVIIHAYNIETDFFGLGTEVPIIEVEQE